MLARGKKMFYTSNLQVEDKCYSGTRAENLTNLLRKEFANIIQLESMDDIMPYEVLIYMADPEDKFAKVALIRDFQESIIDDPDLGEGVMIDVLDGVYSKYSLVGDLGRGYSLKREFSKEITGERQFVIPETDFNSGYIYRSYLQ